MSGTPNLNLTYLTSGQLQPEVTVNADLNMLDSVLAAAIIVALTNANVTLTAAQAQSRIIRLQGALTANVIIYFPASLTLEWVISNETTGAYTVNVEVTGGSSTVAVTQGSAIVAYSNGTNLAMGALPVSNPVVSGTLSITNAGNNPLQITSSSSGPTNTLNIGFATTVGGDTNYNFEGPNCLLSIANSNDNASVGWFESYDTAQFFYIQGMTQTNIAGYTNIGRIGSFVPSSSPMPTWRNLLDDGSGNAAFVGMTGAIHLQPLAAPAAPMGTPSSTGGTLPAATYYARVVAFDGNGGAVVGAESAGVTTTGSTSSITWEINGASLNGGVANYQLWVGTVGGGENTYVNLGNSVGAAQQSYLQTATLATSGTLPSSNTTGKIAAVNFATGIAPSALTIGASPWVYQNTNAYGVFYTYYGGTLSGSSVAISADNSTYVSLGDEVTGTCYVPPGFYVKYTYTTAPLGVTIVPI